MIVPDHWAEARERRRIGKRTVVLRRFGWSDTSLEAAEAHATQRVNEAFELLATNPLLRRREPKVPYNGADGVPIREEVVERAGELVVTRNAYGAKCLNTPDVLFADLDFEPRFPGCAAVLPFAIAAWIAGGVLAWRFESIVIGVAALVAGPLLGGVLQHLASSFVLGLRGGPERVGQRRIDAWSRAHPDWSLRVYATPAGLRVLVTHRTFDPVSSDVAAFFTALGTDPLYARMCTKQRCFRARLSPKPWRIGLTTNLKPRPGVWPVKPERLQERRAWLDDYDQRSLAFSACRFVRELGTGTSCDAARRVVAFHDEASGALSERPIA